MLYDVNAQEANTPRSQAPSTASQQVFTKSNLMTKSGGILHPPNVVIQPPSDSSTKSKEKRPSYQRQASQHSTPMILNPFEGTPNFQDCRWIGDNAVENSSIKGRIFFIYVYTYNYCGWIVDNAVENSSVKGKLFCIYIKLIFCNLSLFRLFIL